MDEENWKAKNLKERYENLCSGNIFTVSAFKSLVDSDYDWYRFERHDDPQDERDDETKVVDNMPLMRSKFIVRVEEYVVKT